MENEAHDALRPLVELGKQNYPETLIYRKTNSFIHGHFHGIYAANARLDWNFKFGNHKIWAR
jgi:hypothetical protein